MVSGKLPKSPRTRQALMDVAQAAIRSLAPSEASIEQTCTEWLALDGWRSLKTDPVSRKEWGKGFGELGMADRLYIRYIPMIRGPGQLSGPFAEILWIEWKKKGGKAKAHQRTWIATERMRGALVWLAGEDFPASIEGFQAWYRASGLMRRKI